jgi:hypothetical protein
MNKHARRRLILAEGCLEFSKKPELVLTAKPTALFAELGTNVLTLKRWDGETQSGGRNFRDGAKQRQEGASKIHDALRDISDLANTLELEGHVGATEKFRMPIHPTFHDLLGAARAFADNAEPMQALFVEHGLPATFIADLEALITSFESATGVKVEGFTDRVGGNAGVDAAAADCLKTVQKLRPVMRILLRNQPALLAGWNAVSRLETNLPPEEDEQEPAPDPASSGESGTSAVADPGTGPS